VKTKGHAALVLLAGFAGVAGYYTGALREKVASHVPTEATVALGYLISPESFSEVEQARAVLEALADCYAVLAQQLMVRDLTAPSNVSGPGAGDGMPSLPTAIRVLEEAMGEFKDTGQDLRLLPLLLHALKREGRYDRWLDLYLGALYAHPTHRVVADLAEQAVAISRAVGRQAEVAAGFQHLRNIPQEFGVHGRIESLLAGLGVEPRDAG
jgi:hypothetical protein